jgi:nicotinic acid mononucleotide adenylyltransferase
MTKSAILTWGRMNPPTVGHKHLIQQLLIRAKETGADPFVVVTHSKDPERNPLSPEKKKAIVQRMFPSVTVDVSSPKTSNPLAYITKRLKSQGYTKIFFILGSDHDDDFKFVEKNAAVERIRPGVFRPEKGGVSATNARLAARAGNKKLLRTYIDSSVTNEELNNLMHLITKNLP